MHTGLSGPAYVAGTGGVIYRLIIRDDSSTGAGWLRLLTNKHEESTLEAFKEYKAMAEAQHPVCRLMTIQNDRGADSIRDCIAARRREHGIQAQHIVRGTPRTEWKSRAWFLGPSRECYLHPGNSRD